MNEKRAAYTQTRYSLDAKRTLVWKVFAPFLQKKFQIQGHVLDVGCGFGDFINHIEAPRKSALDANADMQNFLQPGIDFKDGLTSDLKTFFKANDFDWIFSSNLL
ncbi:MAG TPA: class I SAM-dependent methyltransferase, partial [Pseudobdellovibrionaceae bacterium]